MADLVTLSSLSPREAVEDALYRCILGIDSNNRELMESACLKSEEMTITIGPATVSGWTAISAFFLKVFALVTTHVTSNIRVELKDGANTASLTAHVIAYHVRPDDALTPEDTSYTVASLYNIDLIKDGDDGLWKIKKWGLQILWSTGDKAILH
ncbi:hypothetical protein VE03_03824 [Pseudogymnoascus sp. 23342-1-I1]|nr:hypothetical protein VE03_03824 [Pseudogymnoascus sp. 23342-1-I1]